MLKPTPSVTQSTHFSTICSVSESGESPSRFATTLVPEVQSEQSSRLRALSPCLLLRPPPLRRRQPCRRRKRPACPTRSTNANSVLVPSVGVNIGADMKDRVSFLFSLGANDGGVEPSHGGAVRLTRGHQKQTPKNDHSNA